MRLATVTLISTLGLAAFAGTAKATSLVPGLAASPAPDIVQVRDGCGRGFHPVPGYWDRWRHHWVPPHCVPNWERYGGRPYDRHYPDAYGDRRW
jgi:hypothetical protein